MKGILLALAIVFGSFLHAQNVEWVHSMGGTHRDKPVAMDIDGDGNTYVTGTFVSPTLTFSDSDIELQGSDSTDIFLYKRSPTGELLWAKVLGSEGNDHVFDLKVDEDGNAYVVGWFTKDFVLQDDNNPITLSGGLGIKKGFVAKYDPSGNLLNALAAGSDENFREEFVSIAFTPDSNLFLCGYFHEETLLDFTNDSFQMENTGLIFLKLTKDFEFISANNWENSDFLENENYYMLRKPEVIFTDDGGFVANLSPAIETSILNHNPPYTHRILSKISSEYEREWFLSTYTSNIMTMNDLTTDASGNIYLTGRYLNINLTSSIQNQNIFHLNSYNNTYDAFLAKISPDGAIQWLKGMGGPGHNVSSRMTITSSGNVLLTGYFSETMDFDPSLNEFNLTASGYSSMWAAMYTPNGELMHAFKIGNDNFINATDIKVGPNDEIYISGWFNTSTQFDADQLDLALNSNGQHDVFTMKLGAITVGMNEAKTSSNSILIFPNPTSETVSIHADGIREIKIFDITGKTISTISTPHFQDGNGLSVNHLPKGLYLLQLKLKNGEHITKKLVVE